MSSADQTENKDWLTIAQEAINSQPTESTDSNPSSETSQQPADRYFYIKELGIRFKLPDGVTNVDYDYQKTPYDGSVYIKAITKNEKVYDIEICGGKNAYRHYSFFHGYIGKWDSGRAHTQNEIPPYEQWSDQYRIILDDNGTNTSC